VLQTRYCIKYARPPNSVLQGDKNLVYGIVQVKCHRTDTRPLSLSSSQFSTSISCVPDHSPTATFQMMKQRFMQTLEKSRYPNNRAGGCYWQVMVFRLCGWRHIWILSISVMSTSNGISKNLLFGVTTWFPQLH